MWGGWGAILGCVVVCLRLERGSKKGRRGCGECELAGRFCFWFCGLWVRFCGVSGRVGVRGEGGGIKGRYPLAEASGENSLSGVVGECGLSV